MLWAVVYFFMPFMESNFVFLVSTEVKALFARIASLSTVGEVQIHGATMAVNGDFHNYQLGQMPVVVLLDTEPECSMSYYR